MLNSFENQTKNYFHLWLLNCHQDFTLSITVLSLWFTIGLNRISFSVTSFSQSIPPAQACREYMEYHVKYLTKSIDWRLDVKKRHTAVYRQALWRAELTHGIFNLHFTALEVIIDKGDYRIKIFYYGWLWHFYRWCHWHPRCWLQDFVDSDQPFAGLVFDDSFRKTARWRSHRRWSNKLSTGYRWRLGCRSGSIYRRQ